MSDGENDATLGPMPPRGFGAAPWERSYEPLPDDAPYRWRPDPSVADAPTVASDPDEHRPGSHTDGSLSVADLIAKVGAPVPDHPTHHHLADDTAPDAAYEAPDEAPEESPADELEDTLVLPTPAYAVELAAELPDLSAAALTVPQQDPVGSDEATAEAPASSRSARRRLKRERRAATKSAKPAKPANGTPKSTKRRPILVAGRVLVALIAVLTLGLTGGAWRWSAATNGRFNTVSALDMHSGDIIDPQGQYGDENFLIVGMDSRAGANGEIGAGDTEDAGGARSDTVMLVNIPANRKRVVVVSFPRDLAITPMQCEAWNPDTGKYGPLYDPKRGTWGPKIVYTETKLNSTFSFGGPKCLVKEIQKLSGLSINRFIAIDFVGFGRMVEALGGVEVCSATALKDYELGTVLEHSGRQVINGPTALNYVRARQVTTEINGDYGRIKRQQRFVSSLLRALISEDTLLNPNKLNNLVNIFIGNSYVDNVKTKDLVQLGQSLHGMAAGHITFVTVPTGVTDQNGDEPPRTADMKALFTAVIDDEPLPLENDHNAQSLGSSPSTAPTPSSPTPTPKKTPPASPETQHEQVVTTSPQEVTVQVSNGTGTSGLASTAATQLKRNGFNVMTPDDYPSSLKTTTVFFSPGNEQAAATVASSFANSKIERVSGIGQVIQVVLGADFNAVSAPAPSGSSISMQFSRNTSTPPTTTKLPEDLTVTNAADTTCE